jgi:hypothetical protein
MAGGGSSSVPETAAQKALAQHAVDVLADYKARWLPVQMNLADQIEREGGQSSWQRVEAKGRAANESAIQFGRARGAMERGLTNAGAHPGSGRFAMAESNMSTNEGKSSGLGQMMSDQAITQAYTQGLQALTQIGRGESATVGSSMAQQARNSAVQAQADAAASLQSQENYAGLAGEAIGAGFGMAPPKPPPVVQGSNPNGYNGAMNNPFGI